MSAGSIPCSAVSDNRQWLPQSRCGEAATLGCDRNGDLTPQINELGPSSGYTCGTQHRYEPGYDWPNANEYTVEVQRQLPGNLVISGGYTRREKRNQLGVRNVAVPMDTYIPLTSSRHQRADGDGLQPESRRCAAGIDNLWDNDAEMDSTYNGGDITAEQAAEQWLDDDRRSQRRQERRATWAWRISITRTRNSSAGAFRATTCRSRSACRGCTSCPYGISLSGSYQYQKGFPELTTVSVGNNTVALDAGHPGGHRRSRAATCGTRLNQLDYQPSQGHSAWAEARCSSRGWTSTT